MKTSSDGINWPNTYLLDATTGYQDTPTPVVWLGALYVFAIDNRSAHYIWQWDINGTSASGPYNEGAVEYSNYTVAATSWNDVLYLSWAGTGSGNPIYIKHRTLASGWSNDTVIPGNSGRPSLYPLQPAVGKMEMVYRGNNGHIYRTYTSDGVTFSLPIQSASTTNQTPIPFVEYDSSGDVWTIYVGQNGEVYTTQE